MKRSNSEHIGSVIQRYLRQQGLETPLNQYRLVASWKDVAGPVVVRYTRSVFIKNQTLYVQLTSSVLRQELAAGADILVRNLNGRVGAQVITGIVFY